MKRTLAVAAIVSFLSLPALAQQPTPLAAPAVSQLISTQSEGRTIRAIVLNQETSEVQTLYLQEIERPQTEGDKPRVARQVVVDVKAPKVGSFTDLTFGRASLHFTKRSATSAQTRSCQVYIARVRFGEVTCPRASKSGRR